MTGGREVGFPPGGEVRDGQVYISALTHDTAEEAAALYTRVFLNDEPMTCRHGIDPARFLPFAREYLHFCAEQGLSIVAADRGTDEVVGFALCSDLATDWNAVSPGISTLLSLFGESMEILGEVESRCPDLLNPEPGTVLHLFQLGVREAERGRGIAICLVSSILSLALHRGYSRVIAECTGPGSRHICERCGFSGAAYVAYDDFVVNGQAFFAGISGGITLMIRDL
ncbi:MAG: Acetyltransferase (GNAT) family protein [Methanoregulaceae archaeon PtaU1.Bin059]|nr:MAG: Acetyltransferase (GNAT) family protein [Methanoregulaceae archaeon PtaB.Bin152]OPY43098.1 MAG: Acetyltransferase (GNAT) family protein [Methanoregulaceae archaeon PtaU1.Bin059]